MTSNILLRIKHEQIKKRDGNIYNFINLNTVPGVELEENGVATSFIDSTDLNAQNGVIK